MISRVRWVAGVAAMVAVAGAAPGGWEVFRSERALATVDFPVPPEEKVTFVEGKDYRLERVSYAAESPRAAYRLSSVPMPENVRAGRMADEILRSAALAAKPKNWTLRDQVWVSMDDAAALRFVTAPEAGVEVHHYYYLNGSRLYTLVVVVPPGEAQLCEVDRFFLSFRPLESQQSKQ